jgi:hypothetical protein
VQQGPGQSSLKSSFRTPIPCDSFSATPVHRIGPLFMMQFPKRQPLGTNQGAHDSRELCGLGPQPPRRRGSGRHRQQRDGLFLAVTRAQENIASTKSPRPWCVKVSYRPSISSRSSRSSPSRNVLALPQSRFPTCLHFTSQLQHFHAMSVFVNYAGPKLDKGQNQIVRSQAMVSFRGRQKQAKTRSKS